MPQYRNPGQLTFEAELRSDDRSSGTYILFPLDAEELFGAKGRVPVLMTVGGAEYRGSLVKHAGRRIIGIPKMVREKAGAEPGDVVEIVLELDQPAATRA